MTCYLTDQNLLEFLAVTTNPKRVQHPLSLDQALQIVVIYETSFQLLTPLKSTFATFSQLIARYPKNKSHIFDLCLAATALDNNISAICTWNVRDFDNIKELDVMTLKDILKNLE